MKILVPTPKIELYKTGFEGIDLLERQESGKQLSKLIERVEEPLVIAVDGEWGSGKSFFLKCWVGAHTLENNGTAETIYFDAFRNDFLDDPLLSLTSALAERLEERGVDTSKIETLKSLAGRLWRPAARIALAAATAGGTEIAGAFGDRVLNAVEGEVKTQIADLWQREAGQRAAMEQFREALAVLTVDPEDSEKSRKIVITIDELDRCRPDYALSVLEKIKHFFDVPNVHFVLGVNLSELAHSVRARYGSETNAGKYLQKFISLRVPLSDEIGDLRNPTPSIQIYFREKAQEMSLADDFIRRVYEQLELPNIASALSLRTIEKLLCGMAISPASGNFESYYLFNQHLLASILILKVGFPVQYQKARAGTITLADFHRTFGVTAEMASARGPERVMDQVWRAAIDGSVDDEVRQSRRFFGLGSNALRDPPSFMMKEIRDAERLQLPA